MEFELQPGDYIPTSEVPADKQQAVIDAFVEAGAIRSKFFEDFDSIWNYEFIGWWVYQHDNQAAITATNQGNMKGFTRFVTPEQILGKHPANVKE